jgi:hypothetical protein
MPPEQALGDPFQVPVVGELPALKGDAEAGWFSSDLP